MKSSRPELPPPRVSLSAVRKLREGFTEHCGPLLHHPMRNLLPRSPGLAIGLLRRPREFLGKPKL